MTTETLYWIVGWFIFAIIIQFLVSLSTYHCIEKKKLGKEREFLFQKEKCFKLQEVWYKILEGCKKIEDCLSETYLYDKDEDELLLRGLDYNEQENYNKIQTFILDIEMNVKMYFSYSVARILDDYLSKLRDLIFSDKYDNNPNAIPTKYRYIAQVDKREELLEAIRNEIKEYEQNNIN